MASLGDEIAEASGAKRSAVGDLAKLLEDRGIDLDLIGDIKAIRVNEWQAMHKDAEGEAHVTDLRAASLVLSPSWEQGPKWPVVQPAAPVSVRVPKARPKRTDEWQTAVLLPDIQFGYRRLLDGTLDSFHDETALAVALQIVEYERPDVVVFLGDVLDLAAQGRFRYEPGFAMTTQPAIDRAHAYIAQVVALCDKTLYLSGNHDERLRNYIIDNARESYGLKRAGEPPESWPSNSVPYLLRLDELGVEYVGAYPAGATYLNDNFACIHGAAIGNRTKSAAQINVEREVVAVAHGHTHKKALAYKQRNTRGNPVLTLAYSPGCLCRTDGAVPSRNANVDERTGRPVKAWEDWHQGVGIVRFTDDGRYAIEDVSIFEGFALHHGREFRA